MKCTGIVLAGPKTTIPGRYRVLAQFKEKPLVLWTVQAMSRFCTQVIVAAGHECGGKVRDAIGSKYTVVEDQFVGIGPVGGIHAGLQAAQEVLIAVAPAESPILCGALYELLCKEAKGHDGAVPKLSDGPAVFHAVYRTRPLLKAIERDLVGGTGKMGEIVRTLDIKSVGARKIESVDPEKKTFWELTSTEALRAVERMLK